jgi:prepilin-type N-terminal cleavage/methylation domain-containing protein/prepilin-type processing-associated H-X9-DG protein
MQQMDTRAFPRMRGFTLIEILVAFSIIAVLVSMILPALRSVKRKSDETTCLNNLRQIGIAMGMYMNDHDQVFPPCQHYISWAGGTPEVWMEGPTDLQYVLNDYIGPNDGTHKNNMASKIWVCPAGAKYGRKGVDAVSPFPYRLGRFNTPGSWWGGKGTDITYRYNSRTTRDRDNMYGNTTSTRSYPQSTGALKTPSQAALIWDFPDNLPLYTLLDGIPYLMHRDQATPRTYVNCLFADFHVEIVPTNTDVYTPVRGMLSWYAGWGSGQGWDGAVVN